MNKPANAHYVDNAKFSQAVLDYVTKANECRKRGEDNPVVDDYIAQCFLRIAEGLSFKSNFSGYTYREEMAMDAVENCLRAIRNYDIEAATRTGKPNAFAYFTQISWYAFLRRIAKEKKQQDLKLKYLAESGYEEFMIDNEEDPESSRAIQSFIDSLRQRIDEIKEKDGKFEEYKKTHRTRARKTQDSDLSVFFDMDELEV